MVGTKGNGGGAPEEKCARRGEEEDEESVVLQFNPRSFVVSIDGDPGSRLQLGPFWGLFAKHNGIYFLFFILDFGKGSWRDVESSRFAKLLRSHPNLWQVL